MKQSAAWSCHSWHRWKSDTLQDHMLSHMTKQLGESFIFFMQAPLTTLQETLEQVKCLWPRSSHLPCKSGIYGLGHLTCYVSQASIWPKSSHLPSLYLWSRSSHLPCTSLPAVKRSIWVYHGAQGGPPSTHLKHGNKFHFFVINLLMMCLHTDKISSAHPVWAVAPGLSRGQTLEWGNAHLWWQCHEP